MSKQQFPQEFEIILDECLDAVLANQTSIAECLERYPEYAAQLKPELQAALLVARLKSPVLADDSIANFEQQLRARMQTRRQRKVIQFAGLTFSRSAAAVMIVFLMIFGSGGSLVAASANSLPGETLYPVKRLWEMIILLLAPLTGELDDLWLHMAQTRFEEIQALADQGNLTDAALFDLYDATAKTIELSDAETAALTMAYMEQAQTFLETADLPLQYEILYQALIGLMAPIRTQDGRLLLPAGLQPNLNAPATSTAVSTESLDPTPTTQAPTATSSATATASPTITLTATPRDTATPRIPPTATQEPTLSPTPTLTHTPLPTATFTWTPLPLPPSRTPSGPVENTQVPATLPPGPSATPPSPQNDSPFVRQTQQAVYLTQTAQAQNP